MDADGETKAARPHFGLCSGCRAMINVAGPTELVRWATCDLRHGLRALFRIVVVTSGSLDFCVRLIVHFTSRRLTWLARHLRDRAWLHHEANAAKTKGAGDCYVNSFRQEVKDY